MPGPLFEFTVWGEPRPKQRPKHGKHNTYTPKRTREAEDAVSAAFRLAYPLAVPSVEHLRLDAVFYRKHRTRVDNDNLLKLVTDALNGLAYADDSQLFETYARKSLGHGDRARTEVRIFLLEEHEWQHEPERGLFGNGTATS